MGGCTSKQHREPADASAYDGSSSPVPPTPMTGIPDEELFDEVPTEEDGDRLGNHAADEEQVKSPRPGLAVAQLKPVGHSGEVDDPAAPASVLDPSTRGITLSAVRELLGQAMAAAGDHPGVLTTRHFVERFIKPATATLKRDRTLATMLPPDQVAEFDTFVSHAWDADVVSVLRTIVADGEARETSTEPEPCFFLDVACVNQHKAQALGDAPNRRWWADVFTKQIGTASRLLIVASPFDSPLVATRLWCLLEAVTAGQAGLALTLRFPRADEESLLQEIADPQGHSALTKMLTSVDSRHAKTTQVSDGKQLRTMIEANIDGSCAAVDKMFARVLQDGVFAIGERHGMHLGHGSTGAADFAARMGELFATIGDSDRAMTFHKHALATRLMVLDTSHPQVADSLAALGALYAGQGDAQLAQDHHSRALLIRLETLGPRSREAARSYSALAQVKIMQKSWAEAVQILRLALEIELAAYGAKSLVVTETTLALGGALLKVGDIAAAIEALEKSLMVQLDKEDPTHLLASTYQSLGEAHALRGEHREALWNYNESLRIARAVQKTDPSNIAACLSAIATINETLGDFCVAIEHHQQTIVEQVKALGTENHTSVATAHAILAASYTKQGDLPRAVNAYGAALKIWTTILAEKSDAVADAYRRLGSIYRRQTEFESGIDSFKNAVTMQRELFGPRDSRVADTLDEFGALYADQGNHGLAIEVHNEALSIRLEAAVRQPTEISSTYNMLRDAFTALGLDADATDAADKAEQWTSAPQGSEPEVSTVPAVPTAAPSQTPLCPPALSPPAIDSRLMKVAAMTEVDSVSGYDDDDEEEYDDDDVDVDSATTNPRHVPSHSASGLNSNSVDSGHHSIANGSEIPLGVGLDGFIGDGFDSRRESPVMFAGAPVAKKPVLDSSIVDERAESPEYTGWGDEDSTLNSSHNPMALSPTRTKPAFRVADPSVLANANRARSDSYRNATANMADRAIDL
mmetsp:Transcript_27398/g.71900  ORF Transcript_27398/g.71900 Transcript_27398/m.71900 type:complete len:982 (-) Transcript_27398:88-3033(-)